MDINLRVDPDVIPALNLLERADPKLVATILFTDAANDSDIYECLYLDLEFEHRLSSIFARLLIWSANALFVVSLIETICS